ADAARHPDRNALISALTGDELDLVDLPRRAYALERGDQVLLASDGVLTLEEHEIATVLAGSVPGEAGPCQRLLEAVTSRQAATQDNVTVLWVRPAGLPTKVSLWRRLWWRLEGGWTGERVS
ncbi:hypothetical protein RZS08_38305, partial [Arthrospira platensis SPKY1]|nr:hypothetical protein [Arthrospira platensis SPKY1]